MDGRALPGTPHERHDREPPRRGHVEQVLAVGVRPGRWSWVASQPHAQGARATGRRSHAARRPSPRRRRRRPRTSVAPARRRGSGGALSEPGARPDGAELVDLQVCLELACHDLTGWRASSGDSPSSSARRRPPAASSTSWARTLSLRRSRAPARPTPKLDARARLGEPRHRSIQSGAQELGTARPRGRKAAERP